jgi:hypothetical protein
MKFHVKYVLFFAAYRILSPNERKALIEDFAREKPSNLRKFMAVLNRHFEILWLKDKPFIWQDIWLYNYLTYESNGTLKPKSLFKKYYKIVEEDLVSHYHIFRPIAQYLA